MKVTFVTSNYWPSVGGAQLHFQRVAEGLVRDHGHAVDVLTTDAVHAPGGRSPGAVDVPDEIHNGVRIRRFAILGYLSAAHRTLRRAEIWLRGGLGNSSQIIGSGPLAPRLYLGLWQALREADLVVVVNTPLLILVATRMARITGRPLAVAPLLHTDDPTYPSVIDALRHADHVVCNTEHERSWLVERGVRPDRATVIPPGCDLPETPRSEPAEARAAAGLPERTTVGLIGRLAPHKGVETFLDAARRLRDGRAGRDPVQFLIAGTRTGWDGLDVLIEDGTRPPDPWLVVIESFGDEDKANLYRACDIVVFPSRSESFGMVILESWAARRALVTSAIGAVRSVVHDGADAVLVPPGDAGALAAAVDALLDDPARRGSLADAGHARVVAEFTWSAIVARWDAVLRDHAVDPTSGAGRRARPRPRRPEPNRRRDATGRVRPAHRRAELIAR